MGFHAALSSTFRNPHVRIFMGRDCPVDISNPRALIRITPPWPASFYDVYRAGDTVVKVSKSWRPFLEMGYARPSNVESTRRGLTDTETMELVSLSGYFGHQTITNAYLRAKMDQTHFEQLCRGLDQEHLVDQSVCVAWNKFLFKFVGDVHEVIFQPYVEGTNLVDIVDCPASARYTYITYPGYEHLIPVIGPQMRMFMGAKPFIDLSPVNFILTPEERLIYIDYQPFLNPETAAINMSSWTNYLNAWGF